MHYNFPAVDGNTPSLIVLRKFVSFCSKATRNMIKSVIYAHYNYECHISVYKMVLMFFGLLWRRTFDSALKEFELS